MSYKYNVFISYSSTDNKLAQKLQSALHQFNRPWNKLRALHVFRDETNLTVSSGLWSSIENALSSSEYFLLMASPVAAQSMWVKKEIDFWFENRSPQNLLITLTDGNIEWDYTKSDFDWDNTNALPVNMKGKFTEVPRWIDFREISKMERLSLNDLRFKYCIADITSKLLNKDKDILIGEDIQKKKRLKLLTWIFVLILTITTAFASFEWWNADRQRRLALSRQLIAQAENLLEKQFDLSLLLGIEANNIADTVEAKEVLFDCFNFSPLLQTFLHGHKGRINCIAFGPDGKRMVSGSDDGKIIQWDMVSCKPIESHFEGLEEAIIGIAYSSDGKTIVSGSSAGKITLWSATNGKPISQRIIKGLKSSVIRIAISYDIKKMALELLSDEIVIVDIDTLRPIEIPLKGNFAGSLCPIIFCPDGKTLVSGSIDDNSIVIWSLSDLKGKNYPIGDSMHFAHSLAFSSDGRTLAVGGFNSIVLWDMTKKMPIQTIHGGYNKYFKVLAFSPGGKIIASGTTDNEIILWYILWQNPLGLTLKGHDQPINCIAFSPDGKTLASASNSNKIIIWNLANGINVGTHLKKPSEVPISAIAFNPDGKLLASGSWDHKIIIWDMVMKRPMLSPFLGHKSILNCITFSPDGKTLASGGGDETIILWDIKKGVPVAKLIGHKSSIMSVSFSPDGKTLASGSSDHTIILWDVNTGKSIGHALKRHKNLVTSIVFNRDGKLLASGGWDQQIVIWDVAKQEPLGLPLEHKDQIMSIAFSPKGETLVSAGVNSIILWDIATRKRIPISFKGSSSSIAFSPDGKTIASGNDLGEIVLYDVFQESWRDRVKRIANRNMTYAEWRRFLGMLPYHKTFDDLPFPSDLPEEERQNISR